MSSVEGALAVKAPNRKSKAKSIGELEARKGCPSHPHAKMLCPHIFFVEALSYSQESRVVFLLRPYACLCKSLQKAL